MILQRWMGIDLSSELYLPPPNEFIPENFDIYPLDENVSEYNLIFMYCKFTAYPLIVHKFIHSSETCSRELIISRLTYSPLIRLYELKKVINYLILFLEMNRVAIRFRAHRVE